MIGLFIKQIKTIKLKLLIKNPTCVSHATLKYFIGQKNK